MTVSAIGSLAQSILPGQSARKVTPALGLAFRFTVKVDDLDLGAWQSCGGLKVDYRPAEMKAGGSYLGSRYLAGEASYPKIVLRRATVKGDSAKVQTWLRQHAKGLVSGATVKGSGALITLYDSSGEPVMWWQLTEARPSAWSGPDLDATSTKVALETLELVHEGFTVGTGKPPTSTQSSSSQSRSTLTVGDGSKTVKFQFPPTEMQVIKSQDSRAVLNRQPLATDNQPVQSGDDQVELTSSKPNVTTYALNNLILDGTNTQADVDTLTVWATKPQVAANGKATLPDITFTWGDGFKAIKVRLSSLSVTYTRFSNAGVPTRAKVTLKLEERKAKAGAAGSPGGRNPTSGGIPGRSSHLLLQSESLASLAQQAYGDPRRWREVAAANEVDDPFRVAPGTTLLLPAASELPERGTPR